MKCHMIVSHETFGKIVNTPTWRAIFKSYLQWLLCETTRPKRAIEHNHIAYKYYITWHSVGLVQLYDRRIEQNPTLNR